MEKEPIHRVYRPLHRMLHDNFVGGIAWALGATVGFTLFVATLTFFLNILGGLPVIGVFFANIVDATNQALQKR